MEILECEEVARATNGKITTDAGKALKISGVSRDSKSVKPGDLFVAIKGERHDGHDYIEQAMNAGAVGAVVSRDIVIKSRQKDFTVIRVNDTVTALGALAKYYRRKLGAKIVGITGSNGKTTTKEMVSHLLSCFGPTARSQKSYNNYIGVPLSIFEIENRHQYGVLELGTNAPGEIRYLSEMSNPNVAVIVTVTKTHLAGLGSIEGVARAKGEILEGLCKGGTFVYNFDNPWCVKLARAFKGRSIGFGFNPCAQIKCTDVKKNDDGYVIVINGYLEVRLPVSGHHNINNCLAAFAVCHALGHDISAVTDAMASFKLPPMRMEQQHIGKITVINDAYNANPESVRAALRYFNELPVAGKKVFVCGDMLELGSESPQLHREIGELVARLHIDVLWTVGDRAGEIAKGAKLAGMPEERVVNFHNVTDISISEAGRIRENDTVLIKGSRGMQMENIVEKFKEFFLKREAIRN